MFSTEVLVSGGVVPDCIILRGVSCTEILLCSSLRLISSLYLKGERFSQIEIHCENNFNFKQIQALLKPLKTQHQAFPRISSTRMNPADSSSPVSLEPLNLRKTK